MYSSKSFDEINIEQPKGLIHHATSYSFNDLDFQLNLPALQNKTKEHKVYSTRRTIVFNEKYTNSIQYKEHLRIFRLVGLQ